MSDYYPLEEKIIAQKIAETSSTKLLPLGLRIEALDKDATLYGVGEFIYLEGVASTVVGSVVTFNPDDWSTALATANDKASIATAMSINVADQFGWYQVKGKAVGKVLSGFADNAICYLTGTAGSIDDAAVDGDFIYGMKGGSATGTPSSGLAELEIDNPRVRNAADVSLGNLGVTASAGDLNATTNFEETISATTSEVTIATGKTLDITDNSGLQIANTAIDATALEINQAADISGKFVAAGGTLSVTVALHNGRTIQLDTATGSVVTLPAATGTGAVYKFLVTALATSNSHVIQTSAGTEHMQGYIFTMDDTTDNAQAFFAASGTSDTITLNRTTTGSVTIGESITITDAASTLHAVEGFISNSGTAATPFSASV